MTSTATALRPLVDGIAAGELDSSLADLKAAVDARLAVLKAHQTNRDFKIGDRIRFNENTGTRYMIGEYAIVTGHKTKKVIVEMESPKGRFVRYDENHNMRSVQITVPVEIIDHA